MRWSGQEITAEQTDALPGLARMSNLVRSVQTPEFAGVTFHEVLAKSALNKVPGTGGALPFGWTINPYRGCSHACVYCLAPDTPVLMADGDRKPLGSIAPDELVMGTREHGARRECTPSRVLASWRTIRRAYRVTLADGTALVASGDHRFLTDRGWSHVRPEAADVHGPGLEAGDALLGVAPGRAGRIGGDGAVASRADLRVIAVDDLGIELDMVDITTETGDFIANGVVSHNCFARPTHRYLELNMGADFDREIVVKINVADVLRREVSRPSWGRHPVALGTNTDPYQRAEGRYGLMPGIVRALADSGTPFSILTKGSLLRRDLDIIADAATRVPVDLAMSIAVYDDDLQRSIEPGTPSTRARLETVRAVREHGLECSVFMMPILPYLTDSRAHLDAALAAAHDAGASSVLYTALHLRPGVKEWFMLWLEREHPELVPKYRAMYEKRSYAPVEYRKWLAARMRPLIAAHGLRRGEEDPVTGGVRSAALSAMPDDSTERVRFRVADALAAAPGAPPPVSPEERLTLF